MIPKCSAPTSAAPNELAHQPVAFILDSVRKHFKVGDHVRWNSEAGWVSGRIIRVHTCDTDYKGYTHRASRDEPQYEIKSDRTEHIAMHKGGALRKLR